MLIIGTCVWTEIGLSLEDVFIQASYIEYIKELVKSADKAFSLLCSWFSIKFESICYTLAEYLLKLGKCE